MVATPIGNLADITLRALHLLQIADSVACEDTRHSQTLLRAYGIDKTAAQLLAVHQHNESEAAQIVIERLRQGQRVAYASDAGTPAISDPGARLVAAVRLAGLPAIPLPGASTVGRELTKQFEEIASISAEGLPAWLAEDANRLRGEFVLVLHPRPGDPSVEPDDRILKLLLAELPLKTAVKLSAEITGQPRNVLYELALRLKKD